MKLTIWTEAYTPFIMGGDVNAPICTTVEVDEAIDMGCGIQAYLITAPFGKTYVAESVTGAFVGNSIEEVRKNIEDGNEEVMCGQIEQSKVRVKKAHHLSPEDFWGRLEQSQ